LNYDALIDEDMKCQIRNKRVSESNESQIQIDVKLRTMDRQSIVIIYSTNSTVCDYDDDDNNNNNKRHLCLPCDGMTDSLEEGGE
jgi:hypothetical protein